jgi:hypothetical protein
VLQHLLKIMPVACGVRHQGRYLYHPGEVTIPEKEQAALLLKLGRKLAGLASYDDDLLSLRSAYLSEFNICRSIDLIANLRR